MIIATEPDTFGEMTESGGRVRFQFNERISETVADGDLSSAVTVSPLTGAVRVSHGRTSLSVSLEGGFQPGLLYRVTLLPVVSDLFGNRMRDAFELVFSTGGQVALTSTLAGEAWDRLTGRGLGGATVQAVGSDSLFHVARADDSGVFAFRYLPAGDFVVTAFQDQDRDRRLGPREASGSVPISVAAGDTLVVEIPLLAPDTTPAVAIGARSLDSVTVVIDFDDYLDPASSSDQIGIRITREDGEAPLVTRLYHEIEYARYVDQIADSFARLDSLDAADRAAQEQAAADSAAALADTLAPPPPTADSVDAGAGPADTAQVAVDPGGATGAAVDAGAPAARPVPARLQGAPTQARPGRTPPGRRLVGVLDRPLVEGTFEIRVTSVVNISGLLGGGGDVTLEYTPPPPPPPPDSAQAADSVPPNGDATDAGPAAGPGQPAPADTLGFRP